MEADTPVRLRPEPLDLCKDFFFLGIRVYEKNMWYNHRDKGVKKGSVALVRICNS
jgi:hypothetical protein